jgi:class 3 adenylate cyclase
VRRLGPRYGDVRAEHGRLIEDACRTHEGHVIDTQGDAYFAAFERAADAVAAAIDVQRSLADVEWPDGAQLRVRIGLHTAEPFLHASGYVGIGVHRAARICAAAHGGQILVSNATAGIIEDLEPAEFELYELGQFRLKDIARPQRLFQLAVHGLEREFAPPMTLDAARDPYGRVGTLLGADIVGWTRFLRSKGDDAAAEVSADFRLILQETVAAHEGVTLEAIADTVLAVFDRPRDAVDCAVAARVRLAEHAWPWGFDCPTAFVVHTGRLVSKDHGGTSVIHVFELLSEPEPGKILVSHSTEMLLEGERLDPWQLRDLGERLLGSSQTPLRVFELVGDGSS